MAFTEKDMQAQEEQLNALKEELSRLDQKFDAQLKAMGLTEDNLKQQEPMTPELEALVAKAEGRGQARRGSPQGAGRLGQPSFRQGPRRGPPWRRPPLTLKKEERYEPRYW